MRKIHAEEPLVVPSDEPLPDNIGLLVTQIKTYAEGRRLAARTHDVWCRCTPCKVRIYNESRDFARRLAS